MSFSSLVTQPLGLFVSLPDSEHGLLVRSEWQRARGWWMRSALSLGSEGCLPASSLLIEMLKISFIKFWFSFGQVATQMYINISRQSILKKHPLELGLSKSKFNLKRKWKNLRSACYSLSSLLSTLASQINQSIYLGVIEFEWERSNLYRSKNFHCYFSKNCLALILKFNYILRSYLKLTKVI